jgi:hypothetical protein
MYANMHGVADALRYCTKKKHKLISLQLVISRKYFTAKQVLRQQI